MDLRKCTTDQLLRKLNIAQANCYQYYKKQRSYGSQMWHFFVELMLDRIEGFDGTATVEDMLIKGCERSKVDILLNDEFYSLIKDRPEEIWEILREKGWTSEEMGSCWAVPSFLSAWGEVTVEELWAAPFK